MMERTLVLLKPDAVARCLVGEIVSRFERAGLKMVGMRMVWCDKSHALKHYTDDITVRRGENVRNKLIHFLTEGPVVSLCLEGIDAVDVVRKIVGSTEPKTAPPGTIRGDFAHMSYTHADSTTRALPNLIHASGNQTEARQEVALWFTPQDLHSYKTVHEEHVF